MRKWQVPFPIFPFIFKAETVVQWVACGLRSDPSPLFCINIWLNISEFSLLLTRNNNILQDYCDDLEFFM